MRFSPLVFGLLTFLLSPILNAQSRPNILLVMTDDQGYGDISLHGNPVLETPNLDQFASEGIRFTQFQVSPFCAPTRASLLTGRYSLRTGTVGVTTNREAMKPSEVTLAEVLRSGGYRSACIGKWHNGEQFPHNPMGQGFDAFFGFCAGHWNNYFDATLQRNHGKEQTKGYITDVLTDEALRFMGATDQPFFCYLALNAPHTPTQAPRDLFEAFKAQGLDDSLAGIYAMCANIDQNFGRLLSGLEDMGKRENTIVLFLTDNGANTDRFNAGMRGRKTSVHEGGTRVPLFLQWPARWKEERMVEQLAAHIDLFPTLVELCEVEPIAGRPVDGMSLVPWLDGKKTEREDRQIFLYSAQSIPAVPFKGAVRTDQYRAVCEDRKAPLEEGRWQLYDMIKDPGQEQDIAAERPDLVEKLAASYVAWFRDVSGGATESRIEIGHEAENPVTLHTPQAVRQEGLQYLTRLVSGRAPEFGFANDFVGSWTSTDALLEWAIEVRTPGRYRVDLVCNVDEGDAGAVIQVRAAGAKTEGKTEVFPGEQLKLPHLDPEEEVKYINRTWDTQELGVLELPAGSASLVVQALTKPGKEVMKLKEIVLTRLDD